MWNDKRFKHFIHYMLDEMYVLQKMRVVHSFTPIPSKFRDTIQRLNTLRNAIAHSLHPEARREHESDKKVLYRKRDIFSTEGMRVFVSDFDSLFHYLEDLPVSHNSPSTPLPSR